MTNAEYAGDVLASSEEVPAEQEYYIAVGRYDVGMWINFGGLETDRHKAVSNVTSWTTITEYKIVKVLLPIMRTPDK